MVYLPSALPGKHHNSFALASCIFSDQTDSFISLAEPSNAPKMAHAQAAMVADTIAQQGGPAGLQDKEIVALIAYLQRLGRDATQAAPNPLSIVTTAIPGEQLFIIVKRGAIPPKEAP